MSAIPGFGGATRWPLLVVPAALLLGACGDRAGEAGVEDRGDGAASGEATVGSTSGARLPENRLAIPLPEVRVATPSGDTVELRERPDEVTVINFWATWCVPCLEEIPDLVALEDSLDGRDGRVLGIALDSGSPDDVRSFARKHDMDYDLGMARYPWARKHFDLFGLPVTLVVDRTDTIRRRLVGPHDVGQFLLAARPYLQRSGNDAEPN